MTQKQSTDTPVDNILQTIDPSGIADPKLRQTIEILLNLVEQLNSEVKELREENQRLRDENNRLKGEQGKPEIKPKQPRSDQSNHSSEKERKAPKSHEKSHKNESIKIDRQEIIKYPQEKLPVDAQFKGYEEVIVQDINLTTDNVLFRKEKYYSPREGKTYLAELPLGYEGEFGPGVKALVISLYYGSNMTQSKLLEFLGDIGISISAGYLSNLLIKNYSRFQDEKNEVYSAGLASSPWQHFDQTSARVGGVNYTTNIVCNPWYTVYFTTPKKDRLTVLLGLQNKQELEFIINPLTEQLLDTFQIPQKFQKVLKQFPQETVLDSASFNALLDHYLPKLSSQQRTRVLELDERKRLTLIKMPELLLVLEHPEIPLHNNPAELGARTMVQRRNISYGTQTTEGTQAWDTFLSLVATTRKLGISFFEYVRDRITETRKIGLLAQMIRERTALNLLNWSWQTEQLPAPDY